MPLSGYPNPRPANVPNSIVQCAFGRTNKGKIVVPCRLPFAPSPGNDLIGFYSGYAGGGGYFVPTTDQPALLAPTSDVSNHVLGITLASATSLSLGANGALHLDDNFNNALYEVNGLKTRSVSHGQPTVSGNTMSVPFPAASASTTFLLHIEVNNPALPIGSYGGALVQSVSPGVTVDSAFGAVEVGGYHAAFQLRFAGTGAAGQVSVTLDHAPDGGVFALLSLAP